MFSGHWHRERRTGVSQGHPSGRPADLTTARTIALAAGLLLYSIAAGPAQGATPLTTVRVHEASNLTHPVFVTAPPGDHERLFFARQGGAIHIIKDGAVLPTAFIQNLAPTTGDMGLLGFCFDPDYANNGFFYVNYTKVISGEIHDILQRYTVSAGNPDVADPASGITLIDINEGTDGSPAGNRSHNGNMLAFGPNDGLLYAAFGDGGPPKDPENDAQNDAALLGKVLRLDVQGATQQDPYAIPPGNPYADDPPESTRRKEIWCKGLRNPWRFSFDRLTGDFYLADVGENVREELNFLPASDTDGANFGWCCMEGTLCTTTVYSPANPMLQCTCTCNDSSLTLPVHEYVTGSSDGRSIIGGYVYRGSAIPDLQGTYFFADYVSAKIWSLRLVDGEVTEMLQRHCELDPPDDTISTPVSFGEDADGELYIVKRGSGSNGAIFKIVPAGVEPGDMNDDNMLNQLDIEFFIGALMDLPAYIQAHPDFPNPFVPGDFVRDCKLNGDDCQPFVDALLGV